MNKYQKKISKFAKGIIPALGVDYNKAKKIAIMYFKVNWEEREDGKVK